MADGRTGQRRAFYALTSNGDWMEMTPSPDESRPPEVMFIALDVADTDELYDRAEEGAGELLARVIIRDGRPELERVPSDDADTSWSPGDHLWVDFGTGELPDEGCRFCGATLEDIAAAGGDARCVEPAQQEAIARALSAHLELSSWPAT